MTSSPDYDPKQIRDYARVLIETRSGKRFTDRVCGQGVGEGWVCLGQGTFNLVTGICCLGERRILRVLPDDISDREVMELLK